MITWQPDTCAGFDKRAGCCFGYPSGITPGSDSDKVVVMRTCEAHKLSPRVAIKENHFRLAVVDLLKIDPHVARFNDKRILEVSVADKLSSQALCDMTFGIGKVAVI